MIKIGKEIWIVVAIIGFLASWLIDTLAGPVTIAVNNPIAFLQSPTLFVTYPLTVTAIIIRSIALFVSVMLILSLFSKKYFTKALILFICGTLGEFYAIQQLATGFNLTTIQWTLSIAYGSLSLIIGIIMMLLFGIWSVFNDNKSPSEPLKTESENSN